jgi:hypothetical protein
MRPQNTRVWRKTRRAAVKGTGRGRRTTHHARISPPRRGSTWPRRHPGWDQFTYYLENAR